MLDHRAEGAISISILLWSAMKARVGYVTSDFGVLLKHLSPELCNKDTPYLINDLEVVLPACLLPLRYLLGRQRKYSFELWAPIHSRTDREIRIHRTIGTHHIDAFPRIRQNLGSFERKARLMLSSCTCHKEVQFSLAKVWEAS